MAAFAKLLGETLHTKNGPRPTEEMLQGKVVGLYFSAHWCGPCRGFTPRLGQIYGQVKAAGHPFEIVFMSSDRDQASFDEYYAEMPWLALPFNESTVKMKLSNKFQVRGIPTLVLLDEEGQVLTTDGRMALEMNPAGFPWKPKTVPELLGDTLLGKDGPVPLSSLEGKSIAFYFSAHWCPPCKKFTPELVKLYKAMKAAGRDDVEIVFVSSDRDPGSFNEYFAEMPWLALPFERREDKEALSARFEVEGIPTLITVGPDFKVINKNARMAAAMDPTGAQFPWPPKPVEELSQTVDSGGFDVNEKTSVIALTTGMSSAQQEEVKAAMMEVAAEYRTAHADEIEIIFFTASSNTGPVPQVLRMMKIGQDFAPGFIILDIPDNGGFYTHKPDAMNADSIRALLADFEAKKLTRKQLSK